MDDLIIEDEVLAMKEEEFSGMANSILSPPPVSDDRIDSIMKRAKLEMVAKDSADFVTQGVSKGILGIVDTMISLGRGSEDEPPKRSY